MSERTPLNKSSRKPTEKVENRGTFRIVGQVFDEKSNKVVGYGVIDVKNCKLKLCTTKQTLALLSRYEFENAEVDRGTGKIVNTECSMDRLLKFDTKENVIGNAGVTIIGRIYKNNVSNGFRILNERGSVLDVSDKTLLKVTGFGKTIPILNDKIVSRDDSEEKFISAIKREFKRIDIVEEYGLNQYYEEEKRIAELNHKNYLEKLLNIYTKRIMRELTSERRIIRNGKAKVFKDLKIVKAEYLDVKHPDIAKNNKLTIYEKLDLAILVDLANGKLKSSRNPYKEINAEYRSHYYNNGEFCKVLNGFSNNVINYCDELGEEDVFNFMQEANTVINGKVFKVDMQTSKVVSPILRQLLNKLRNKRVKFELKHKVKDVKFNTGDFDFGSVQGIEELGYTVNKNKVGQSFKSPIYAEGHTKKLLFLLNKCGIPTDKEDFVLDELNCFGDAELMRRIKKWLDEEKVAKQKAEKDATYGRFSWELAPEACRIKAEAYLFVLAVNNLALAKFTNELHGNFSNLPLEEINKEKFNLNADDTLFYKSGGKFNRSVTLVQHESWSNPKDKKVA